MIGGAHADTYFVDNPDDIIVEFEGGGFDTVNASATYVLPEWVEPSHADRYRADRRLR